jgi:type I restriction enzyme M protein
MEQEVFPHVPDAKAFFEENLGLKNPKIKTGAEIPFTRLFYKYKPLRPSDEILEEIKQDTKSVNKNLENLFDED